MSRNLICNPKSTADDDEKRRERAMRTQIYVEIDFGRCSNILEIMKPTLKLTMTCIILPVIPGKFSIHVAFPFLLPFVNCRRKWNNKTFAFAIMKNCFESFCFLQKFANKSIHKLLLIMEDERKLFISHVKTISRGN